MNDFDRLKQTIDTYIRVNGTGDISGTALNSILKAMVDTLGAATGKTLLITLDGTELTNVPSADTYGNMMFIFEDSATGEMHRWITIKYAGSDTYAWKDLGITEEQIGDAHGGGFYNLDNEHPLLTGYYDLAMAVEVVANDATITDTEKNGMIIQYFDGDVWKFAFFPKPYNAIDFSDATLWMTFVDPYQAASDHLRAETDHLRATNDHSTAVSDHTRAGTDHDTAVSDHNTATNDHDTAAADHTQAGNDHTRAESDHSTAASDHTQAGTDHSTAVADHTQAGNDHTTAAADHSTAVADHNQAAADHNQAVNDHSQADADHTQAVADSVRADNDHIQAGDDHTRAETDHARAVEDHTRAGTDHTAAQQATAAANTAAGNANTKAAYAKEQGDYAKGEIDGAKGDYQTLNARFNHVDEISMYFEEVGPSADPDLVDEYDRVLRVAYQMISDMQEATDNADAKAALAAAAAALADARSAECVEKTALANNAAAYATAQGNYARQKADEIENAKGDFPTLKARLDYMQGLLEQAMYFEEVNENENENENQ